MADLGHLERMGRELKCPICLSLLRSTASLPCSHMFCGFCISESMRATSSCPVCKVPIHRREVRPAPHMDSLVSIYRNMEAAAGVTIFATQTAAPQNVTGDNERKKASADPRSRKKLISKKSKEGPQNARYDTCNLPKKSSISSNKRVHVTPYPVSETPIQQRKLRKLQVPTVDCNLEKGVDITNTQKTLENHKSFGGKEVLCMNSSTDPVLSPFFCLREDDDDAGTQGHLTSQQTADTDPLVTQLPRFSDIKDSDDEYENVRMTPSSKNPTDQDLDSEMFNWTQRPCSPELCSTPVKKQVARCQYSEKHKVDQTVARKKKMISKLHTNMVNTSKQSNCKKSVKAVPAGKDSESVPLCSHVVKLGTSSNLTAASQNTTLFPGEKIVVDSVTEDTLRGMKPRKRKQPDCAGVNEVAPLKTKDATQNQESKSEGNQVLEPACLKVKIAGIGASVHKKDRISVKNKQLHAESKLSCGAAKENCETGNVVSQERETGNSVSKRKTKKRVWWVTGVLSREKAGNESWNKKGEPSCLSSRTGIPNNVYMGKNKAEKNSPNSVISRIKGPEGNAALLCLEGPGNKPDNINHIMGNGILRKCSSTFQVKCAFCQSTEVTKVSGAMVHYSSGKPVPQDYNGGIGLIHSHKHCTEWAPNVYFENETAINLLSELTRSKRIKCCTCSKKGASLGCYERTCRKSFHFTCAKMIPQCRWDTENFVMLCPLHVASKFPCEVSELKGQKKRRLNSKEESHAPGMNRTGEDAKSLWKWPQGSYKWLFCCSALSSSEKETVSTFTKLAGVSVSKTWASNVTHVITSCDETGACRRTLKVLMGILEGKWIVNIDWLKACISAETPVNEEPFEITVDNHGIQNGPRLGRLRAMEKKPKVFCGFKFYFMGDFSASYKGYLQDLVIAAGGSVLHRRPISKDTLLDDDSQSDTYIIYGCELTDKQNAINLEEAMVRQKGEAKLLADASGTKVASNSWILDCIAACYLRSLE